LALLSVEPFEQLTYDQLVEDWERWMLRKGRAPGTIKGYLWALDSFRPDAPADMRDLTPRQLEAWQDRLAAKWVWHRHPPLAAASAERLSTGSRMQAVTAMRSLLTYCRKQRLGLSDYLPDALEAVRVRNEERHEIMPADFAKLIAYLTPKRPRMEVTDLRTRALFFYLFYSAARVSEVLQVTRSEVEKAIVWQKGGSQKVLYVPLDAVQYVSDYLEARNDDCPWLWVTHQTNTPIRQLHPDGVRDIWRRLTKRLGIPYFVTHQIRHSYATYARKAGVDPAIAQRQLGHTDPRMMDRYRHLSDEDREEGTDQMQDYVRAIAGATPRPRLLPRLKMRRGGR
jgi:integrase